MEKYPFINLLSSAEKRFKYGGISYGNFQALLLGRKNNHPK
jgi:hypothetical protein